MHAFRRLKIPGWHTTPHGPCFAEQVVLQTLEAQGAPAEDLRVLRALLNIFNAFDQPREELPSSDGTDASSQQNSGSVNGELFELPLLRSSQLTNA